MMYRRCGVCWPRRAGRSWWHQRPFSNSSKPDDAHFASRDVHGHSSYRLTDQGVGFFTLTHEHKRNPLTFHVLQHLSSVLQRVAGPEAACTRVLVLQSTGPVFSTGHDFRDFTQEKGTRNWEQVLALCLEVNMALRSLPQPSMAAVQGLATGAGCQLACSADLIVASNQAGFCLPGARSMGFCHTPVVAVAEKILPSRALQMALTGEVVPAEVGLDWGLVNVLAQPAELQDTVSRLAEQMATQSAFNMQSGKQHFYRQLGCKSLPEKYEVASGAMLDMFGSEDQQNFIRSFLTRNKAKQESEKKV